MSASEDESKVGESSPAFLIGNESPAPLRNPSPPKEILGLSDNIGGTAFSKQWFFSTLMKLIKVIERNKPDSTKVSAPVKADGQSPDSLKENQPGRPFQQYSAGPEDEHDSSETLGTSKSSSTPASEDTKTQTSADDAEDSITREDDHLLNISDELQDELCQLWDMSSDEDVARLLQEYEAVEVLTEVISKSDAPRATEIAVGILGNMACTASVCESMADCASLVELSLCLLTNSDAPTLVEATRFLTTILSNERCKALWLKAWSADSRYGGRLLFILSSSVNKDLLENTAALLDHLLDISDDLCNSWSSANLLTSIVEALRQLGLSVGEGTYDLLHCLQLLSTQTNGVSAIVDHVEIVTDILMEFLLKICEDEIVNLEGSRAAGVASVFSVLNIALTSSPAVYSLLYSGEKCIRCILKIIYACDKEIVTTGTPKNCPSLSGGNSQVITMLKDVLYHIIADTVSIMATEETDVSQSEEVSDVSERTTPSLLKYMNSDCERSRLNCVMNLLLSHEGEEVIADILNLCSKYKLDRLEQLILDHGDSKYIENSY